MSINLYPDSNFFERLTKKGNECHWNEFIDECEAHKIDILQGCDPLFTSFLLLERAGLGGILKPLQKGLSYKALVALVQTYIKGTANPKSLSPSSFENCQKNIADILDGMAEIFQSLLHQLPELEITSLLNRLDEEIAVYATSKAANELMQPTLKRVRQFFTDHPKEGVADVIGHLTWNLIVTFPYIEPDTISQDEAASMFDKAVIWFDALFAAFHTAFVDGKRIGFFRLAEARYYAYSKIIAKDPTNPQFAAAKVWLNKYKPLRRKDDLCDGELIDYTVLGSEGKNVFCFTSDDPTDISNRLGLLKGTLADAARDVEGWKIHPCWGRVYCVSEKGQPLKIIHRFLLDSPPPIDEGTVCAQH